MMIVHHVVSKTFQQPQGMLSQEWAVIYSYLAFYLMGNRKDPQIHIDWGYLFWGVEVGIFLVPDEDCDIAVEMLQ